MQPSNVFSAMNYFHEQVTARERGVMMRMARQWYTVQDKLEHNISQLAIEMTARRSAGLAVTEAQLWQNQRYQDLMMQTRQELSIYGRKSAIPDIEKERLAMGQLAATHVQQEFQAQIGLTMQRLPREAVQAMVGRMTFSAPLYELLMKSWPDAAGGLTTALVQGTALGWNPRKTAAAMTVGLDKGLERMIGIARTEQLGVYRHVTLEGYRESGLVSAYRRICARSERTCMACLVDDGHVYELESEFSDHVLGRCRTIATIIGRDELQWKKGSEWFKEQSEATQRKMMGSAKFEAWRDGKIQLGDLLKRTDSPTWGPSVGVKSLKELGIAPPPKAFPSAVAPDDWHSPDLLSKLSDTETGPQFMQKLLDDTDAAPAWQADKRLYAIGKNAGTDGQADSITLAEFKKIPPENRLYRGVQSDDRASPDKYAEQFRSGDLYAGYGVFGNGSYFATNVNTAQSYAGGVGYHPDHPFGNGIISATMKPGARIIEYNDLQTAMRAAQAEFDMSVKRQMRAIEHSTTLTPRQIDEMANALERASDKMRDTIFYDAGRFSLLSGYDGIRVSSEGYTVVLNRRAMMVVRQ